MPKSLVQIITTSSHPKYAYSLCTNLLTCEKILGIIYVTIYGLNYLPKKYYVSCVLLVF